MPANNYSNNFSHFLSSLEYLFKVTTDINEIYEYLLDKEIINQSKLDELLSQHNAPSSDKTPRQTAVEENNFQTVNEEGACHMGDNECNEPFFTDWT